MSHLPVASHQPSPDQSDIFARMVEQANWGIAFAHGENATLDRLNPAFASMHGYTVEELLGTPIVDLFAPDCRDEVARHVSDVCRTGHHVFESSHLRKDGSSFPVQVDATAVRDEGGKVLYRAVIVQDITARRQAEQALRENEERFRRFVEHAGDSFFLFDAAGRVVDVNRRACDSLGYTRDELIGMCVGEIAVDATPEKFTEILATMKPDEPVTLEDVCRRKDGSRFPIEVRPCLFESNGQHFVSALARDMTERRQVELENAYLQETVGQEFDCGQIVGDSPAFEAVLESVRKVAVTDATVLLNGETGTGKEVVARAIHELSGRKDKTLITVNCAALPGGLIESEFFGHEKGAFTGALQRKIGRFEMADGGTIFLDEIGDLPLDLQAKLLRVLEEGQFERVGGTESLKVDARVIAATHRDLPRAVADGKFRADLFYRLNVFPIAIPPLRERKEDIAPLVRHFVLKHSARLGKPIESIPAATFLALREYHWPGNVRELRNVIERAIILCTGPELDLADWRPGRAVPDDPDAILPLAEQERRYILRALEHTGWKVSGRGGAAEVLGLKPTTLEGRMKKHGIRRS